MNILLNTLINSAKGSGASTRISVSKHIRGHIASFSENSDTLSTGLLGAEMAGFKYNIGLLVFATEQTLATDTIYKSGRMDLGWYDSSLISNLTGITASRGGRPVTSISYTLGTDDNKLDYLTTLLSGRNSEYETTPLSIEYSGLTDVDLISKASTIRWEYYSLLDGKPSYIEGSTIDGLAKLKEYVKQTILEKGHHTNFMHWQNFQEDAVVEYFKALRENIDYYDVYTGSYSDIQEYQFVRDSVDAISYSNGTVNISYSKKYPNSPYEKITTSLWVKLNLSGTSLEGKNITTSHGGRIRSMGDDVYHIAVDLDFALNSISFSISETITPNYINLDKPIVSLNGNTFTSDQAVKVKVYSKLKTEYQRQVILEEEFIESFQTTFNIATAFDTVNKDYYIGFINEEHVSGTLEF